MCVLLPSFAGCDTRTDHTAADTTTAGAQRTARDGPVELTLAIDLAEPTVADVATVNVTLTADRRVTVRVDDYGQALAQGDRRFEMRTVRTVEAPNVPTDDGRLRWHYEYEIEFILDGEYELPPATAWYVDEREASDDGSSESKPVALGGGGALAKQRIDTEPLTILVGAGERGAITEEELKTIRTPDPVGLPTIWRKWWWTCAGGVAMAIVLVVWWLRRIRRRRAETVVVIRAHVWARERVAALVSLGLVPQGLVQEFYYGLSGIVRGYIERRFEIAAPEMTTEEFLRAAAHDPRFGADHAEELRSFLESCDLVKYARHDAQTQECDNALSATNAFIDRTREASDAPRVIEKRVTSTPGEQAA